MKDIFGKRFGRLTAINRTEHKRNGSYLWFCQCDCGNTCEVPVCLLTSGGTRSCGCLSAKDITGERFGSLVALKNTWRKHKQTRNYLWLCQCDCGKQVEVPVTALTQGTRKSCGCKHQNVTPGQKRGTVTVLSPIGSDDKGRTIWRWQCDCGNTFERIAGAWWSQQNPTCPECCKAIRNKLAQHMRKKTQHYEPTGAPISMTDEIRAGQLIGSNTSGIRGVSWNKTQKKWIAYIQVDKHQKVLGRFDNKDDAACARAKAVKEIYGD